MPRLVDVGVKAYRVPCPACMAGYRTLRADTVGYLELCRTTDVATLRNDPGAGLGSIKRITLQFSRRTGHAVGGLGRWS